MTRPTAPCDDCGRPVPVPDDWPVDWAYCGCDSPAWPAHEGGKAMSHRWQTYDGMPDIDIFAYNSGEYHNGPRCLDCGRAACHHCHPDIYGETCPAERHAHEEAPCDRP